MARETAFGQRLAQYGKWREKTNMDRFVILAFLTAEEKRDFCKRQGLPEDVDYIDGDDVQGLELKPESEQREVPSGQFVTGEEEKTGDGTGREEASDGI